jgi:NADH-quinone oxidoreductase subunit C
MNATSDADSAASAASPSRLEALAVAVTELGGDHVARLPALPGDLAFEVAAGALLGLARALRDDVRCRFESLADLSGIDYLTYGQDEWNTHRATGTGFSRGVARSAAAEDEPAVSKRFAVTYHLLSLANNQRLRLRVYCEPGEPPVVDSVCDIWPGANWFEREAFDLYGILFRGHPDLRRILTDYGFIGHPFRKDFPLSGHVEVRYDATLGRVVYEPVSIEPRVLVPRVIRDDHRYDPALVAKPSSPGKPNG